MVWSLVAVFTATQLCLKDIQAGNTTSSWIGIFKIQLLVWWVWALITPLIFFLVERFRIERDRLLQNLIFHLLASIVLVLVFLSAYSIIWNISVVGKLNFSGFRSVFIALFLNLFHWHLFIYLAILGIMHARAFYFEAQDKILESIKLEKELIESQLLVLKMQLRPHFLFNALNSIVSSIHRSKLDTAIHMTTDLSELLRVSLSESNQQLIPLSQELHHVRTYLNIEAHRFKELKIEYDLPDELLDTQVPSFLLQPIVENSIKHGISQRKESEQILITIRKKDQTLKVWIYNDGPPLKEALKDGIGISNVKNRLKTIYQDGASFLLKNHKKGVQAEIQLPL